MDGYLNRVPGRMARRGQVIPVAAAVAREAPTGCVRRPCRCRNAPAATRSRKIRSRPVHLPGTPQGRSSGACACMATAHRRFLAMARAR